MTSPISLLLIASLTIRGATSELQRGLAVSIAGERICATHPLPQFYAGRNWAPAWTVNGSPSPVALAMIDTIEHASDHGLRPADYHLDAIRKAEGEELDLLLSDAFFLFASHLNSGRVDPESMEPTWCLPPRSADFVATLEEALDTGQVRDSLERLAPVHPQYRRLLEELAHLRAIASHGGWNTIEPGPPLRAGDSGARTDQLIARLVAPAELDATHSSFDAAVDQAVRRFQRLHGLSDDGVAGPRTIEELNVSPSQRARQIELNLERWRWLPNSLGERYALVNIPSFELSVVEQERTVLSMRIVVGQAVRETPVFSTSIRQVIFNPSWYVPERIAGGELWPKQRRDRSFFRREHIEVLPDGGLRQTPGPWNALGRIKFNMPNRYTVFIHDTPQRTLFVRSERAFSHGCIRVEKPAELAQYLLRGPLPETGGLERAVDLASPFPVHILYWTVFIGAGGAIHYAPDVYGRDDVLDEAMRRKPGPF